MIVSEVETLEQAVGRAVRTLREDHGVTLDQLATSAREMGVRWSTARVIEFEKGQLRITIQIMLAVAQSLSSLTGVNLSLADLVPDGHTWIRVTDSWITKRSTLRTVLGDAPVRLPHLVDVKDDSPEEIAVVTRTDELVATLAEERAARRLGVRPRQVAMWSHLLWGRHLDHEVSERVGPDASPQARGHATRQLVEQIRARLEEHPSEVSDVLRRTRVGGEASDGNSGAL